LKQHFEWHGGKQLQQVSPSECPIRRKPRAFGKLIEKLMLQNSRLWARSTSGMSNYNDGLMAQYKNTVIWRY